MNTFDALHLPIALLVEVPPKVKHTRHVWFLKNIQNFLGWMVHTFGSDVATALKITKLRKSTVLGQFVD